MSNDEIVYRPGDVLAGKYRVDKVVGVGGFGAVLQATHLQLEERVAIKTLLPHAAKNAAASERFIREARAAVRIRSEHVARVSDVGKLDDGTPYMVMEFLDGLDLSNLVKQNGPQSFPDVAEWIIQASEAIAEAHSLGIIHRDLKPANLFLTRRVDGTPNVKVLDFGISKLTNEMGDKGMTKTSDVMGSPFYMSPEQMRSTRSVDTRCDIWAMGAILYELIAGCTPFDAETMTALVVNIMQEPPREILTFRRDVPAPLRDVVLCCLQKDPASRFQDVASLAHALAPFAPARAQANILRINAISGKTSAPTSGAAAVAATVLGEPMQPIHPTIGGGGPGSLALAEQARMTPSGPTGNPAYGNPAISNGHISADRMQQGHLSNAAQPHQPTSQPASHPMSQPTMVAQGGVLGGLSQSGPVVVATPLTPNGPSQSWGGTFAAKKASNTPMFVGIGALLLVGIGGGGFIVMQSRKDPTPPTSQTAAAATPPAAATETATAVPTTPPTPQSSEGPAVTSEPIVARPGTVPPKPGTTTTTTAPTPPVTSKPADPVIPILPTVTQPPPQPSTKPPPKKPGLFDGTD